MSEDKKKIIAQGTIIAYDNDTFDFKGPLKNPLLCQDLPNKGERMIIDLLFKQYMDSQHKRIVVPNAITPN